MYSSLKVSSNYATCLKFVDAVNVIFAVAVWSSKDIQPAFCGTIHRLNICGLLHVS